MGLEQQIGSAQPALISVPCKTERGQEEIRRRSQAIGQRLRTVLLLVDGRRTRAELHELAQRLGASEECLVELQMLGLIRLPEPAPAPELELEPRRPSQQPEARPDASAAPVQGVDAAQAVQPAPLPMEEFIQPQYAERLTADFYDEATSPDPDRLQDDAPTTTRSGLVDSMMSTLFPLLESAFGNLGRVEDSGPVQDPAMQEVRLMLMREVRSRAPVAGAMTVMKLRRAGTREELLALLDEVATHISQPMRQLSAQQILTNARTMLERPN